MSITNIIALVVYYAIKNDISRYSEEFVNNIIIKHKRIPQDLIIKTCNDVFNNICKYYDLYKKNIKVDSDDELDYYKTFIKSEIKIVDDYSSSAPSILEKSPNSDSLSN